MVAQVKARLTYDVLVERVGDQWAVTVPEVPGALSLIRKLARAEAHIREAIAFVAKVDPDAFDVTMHLTLPQNDELAEVRSLTVRAEQLQREAADRTRALVKQLSADGISGGDLATILGVSPQRVSQLLAGR
jgi:predicted RNase H-like HicB family nuclease